MDVKGTFRIEQGNNIDVLKKLIDQGVQVDSVVTDPPYALNFMGAKWAAEVPSIETWTLLRQILKPGGHVLSFGGTRTYHRMVVNMEDAGFEIRDMICWAYGSGMPKSHSVSMAIDKAAGALRPVIGTKKGVRNAPGSVTLNQLARPDGRNNPTAKSCGAYGVGATSVQIELPVTAPATPEAITVRAFFNSWRKRKNVDNNVVFEMSDTHLGSNTKRPMMERYRSFLTFCKENGWITANHAKKIKISSGDVSQNFAWDMQEYENILKTLEKWTDEYGRTGTVEAIRQHAYFLCLRYTGQRLSDVAMLGPDNIVNDGGKWFIALTQVKTGNFVKIPVQEALVRRLQALPLRGELAEPYSMKTNRRTYIYGTKFWFWSGESTTYNNAKEWGEHIAAVLKRTEASFGKFKHKSTPHTARHFFAITMLAAGVPIEMVAKWLGHSSPLITARHYSHANSVFNDASHDAYSKAMEKIEGRGTKRPARKLAIVKKKTG